MMNEQNRTELLIGYLRVLSELKRADYFANKEIKQVMEAIQEKLDLR